MKRQLLSRPRLNVSKTSLAIACALVLGNPAVAAEIQGKVIDSQGRPLQGMAVTLQGYSQSLLSDANGRFSFSNLPAGAYQLSIGSQQTEPLQLTQEQLYQHIYTLADDNIEHIAVVGQGGAISRSLASQRNADNLITVASADAIGEFPDANAAESLQRMAGLSIERDQGEGRYVRVRGLSPELNAVTYNGSQLPSPEAGTRAVALDVIPSDLLESLTVTKTLTPDMDADSLGGSVDIKSLSAFDKPSRFAKFTAEGSYDEHQQQWGEKLAATYSDRFALGASEDNLGIALAGSWFDRKFGSDNIETGGKWDIADNAAKLEEVEMRDYRIDRERLGLGLNLDWLANDDNKLYLRTLYSRFADSETRNALVTEFADSVSSGDDTVAAETSRELKHRKETQTISSIVVGSEHHLQDWKLALQGGWSVAEERNPNGISAAAFSQDFDAGISHQDSRKPVISGPDSLYDADAYELDEIEMEDTKAKDETYNGRFDLSRTLYLAQTVVEVKGGGKFSRRTKTSEESHWVFEDLDEAGLDAAALLLSYYSQGDADYEFGRFGPSIDASAIRAQLAALNKADFYDELESTINDYSIDENVNAGYLMATSDWGDLRMVAGVRYEHTALSGDGWQYSEAADSYSRRHVSHDYGNWLPSLQFRYGVNQDLVLRAAWTHSLVRPTFEQVSPGYLLEGSADDKEASFGNPTLQPLKSANWDLMAEYYFGSDGVISAGLFYKDIDNFIYEADLAGRSGYEDFSEAKTFINGDTSTLYGLELNYMQKFTQLPSPWDGLLLSANLTLSRSEADISWLEDGELQSREISFPSQSDTTGNLAIGYEDKLISLRLSAAYKSRYLQEVGELDDGDYDIYQDDHLQLDFIAKVSVTEDIMVYFKALNLSDEPLYTYTGSSQLNAQYEDYGRSYQLGINISGF